MMKRDCAMNLFSKFPMLVFGSGLAAIAMLATLTLDDARSKLEDWRRYYNEERPHGGIGQKTPILRHNPGGASSPPQGSEAENSGLR